jgi:hypothetical protein
MLQVVVGRYLPTRTPIYALVLNEPFDDTLRRRYVAVLRAADGHDIGPLLAFARS